MKRNNYWIISDTHFGHNKLVTKGYRHESFENKILVNCSNVVRENDILIHLGDVSFYNNKDWHELFINQINCKRAILVLGNHDRETLSWYYDRGWSFVCHQFDLEIYGYRIKFSHAPLNSDMLLDGSINIHGHLHDKSYRTDETTESHVLVSIEETMAPIQLSKLIGV